MIVVRQTREGSLRMHVNGSSAVTVIVPLSLHVSPFAQNEISPTCTDCHMQAHSLHFCLVVRLSCQVMQVLYDEDHVRDSYSDSADREISVLEIVMRPLKLHLRKLLSRRPGAMIILHPSPSCSLHGFCCWNMFSLSLAESESPIHLVW